MSRVRHCIALAALLSCALAFGADAESDPPAEPPTEDGTLYARELRTVEEDVKRLKERVFRSKATLQLLKEIIVEGSGMGSRVVLWHVNKLGPSYKIASATYFLDGKTVFSRDAEYDGDLDSLREARVHEQTIPPGAHVLQVKLVLQGNGLGVFSYIDSYTFTNTTSQPFEVADGEITTVRCVSNEKSGFTRSFTERPQIVCDVTGEIYRREAVRVPGSE